MASGAKLFVGCLPYSKTEADLNNIFEQFGPIQEIVLLKKPDGSSKGAGFVTYQNPESSQTAMLHLQNYTWPGSNRGINISVSGAGGGGGGQHMAQPAAGKGHVVQPPQKGKGGWQQAQQWMPPQQQWQMQQQQWQQAQQWHQPQQQYQPPPPLGPAPAMAYAAAGKGQPKGAAASTEPGTKVFVGQLPYSKSEGDLWQLFGSIGPVAEVVLLKNAATGEKKGAAFVRFHNAHSANAAVAALDGFIFSGSPRAITASIAESDGGKGNKRSAPSNMPSAAATIQSMGQQASGALNINGLQHGHVSGQQQPGGLAGNASAAPAPPPTAEGTKLFVGQLPFSRSENEIMQVFSTYGAVAEVFLHRNQQGQKKGGAFVRFFDPDHAVQALELDGFLFEGATRPITVALAGNDAKRQRVA